MLSSSCESGYGWERELGLIFRFINCVLACLVIWFFVDMKKGRAQAVAFSIQERGLTSEVRSDQVEAVKGDGERVKA
jgi:hypothetical protein